MVGEPKKVELSNRGSLNVFREIFKIPEIGILIPMIFILLVFFIIKPIFFSRDNIVTIMRSMAYYGIIAIGETLVILTGEIDISVGSVAGLGAILASGFMVNMRLDVASSILLALIICGLIGLINGMLIVKLKIPAFIATIGMFYIARGISYLISKGYPFYPLPEFIVKYGSMEPLGTSWAFLIFIVLIIIFDQILRRTVYGRETYATGGNPEVAKIAGINVSLIKIIPFVFSSFFSALSGILLMSSIKTGEPTIGQGWELTVIACVIVGGISLLGGAGTMMGTLIGVIIILSVQNGLVIIGVSTYWQTVAIGLIMIGAVYIDMIRRQRQISI